ncbi:chromo domain-containing protein [Colletotrichum orchidophilum]|uniref:Chromo domain-containing protein n=1 Tax=Colletotrichum orchidophilum TaxID=1209926 RepID=A0A1G4B4I6_9PEZI|nr:chromo domain-containing protein [Colletotrichum orchidophilum]OHE96215.1 chromo domain-containing protein [Colletotrichum orchidophilum]
MSRPSKLIWFGKPPTLPGSGGGTATSSIATRKPPREPEPRRLAVVFEDIPTYRRYKPGTGPRLPPITFVPLRDTTAYIRDEFFVPPALSEDGKKRLKYVVGWTDLPAARLVVDAERICDYVSPMAYEEWCAARAEEQDEEERKLEQAENVRAVEEAEAREKGIVLLGDKASKGTKSGRKKRKKQRAAEELRTPPPAAAGGEKRKRGRPRKNAPSLSTPSKGVLADDFEELDMEGDLEMEEADEDEAIFRQLNGEEPLLLTEDSYDSGEQSSLPAGLEPPNKKQRTRSPRQTLSRLMPGIETDSSRSTPFDSSRGATSSPALPPLPPPQASFSQSTRLREKTIFPPIPPASANHTSTPTAPRIKTLQPPKRSLLSIRDPPSTPQHSSSPKVQTPTPKAGKLPLPATAPPALNPPRNGTGMLLHTPTPRTGFTPLIHNSTPWTVSLAASKAAYSHLTPTQPVQSIEQPSFTNPISIPKPKTTPKSREPQQAALAQIFSAPPATTAGSKRAAVRSKPAAKPNTARKTGGKLSTEASDEEDEQVYEVLRIEAVEDRVSPRSHGKKTTRFFRVRWKGNWPSSMNPTWEPESNIPQHVIKNFYIQNGYHPKNPQVGAMDKYLIPRQYSSVSQAFEDGEGGEGDDGNDDDDDDDNGAQAEEGDEIVVEGGDAENGDDDQGDEMLLVTDEPGLPFNPTFSR